MLVSGKREHPQTCHSCNAPQAHKVSTARRWTVSILTMLSWGLGWFYLQPPLPFWINELSWTAYLVSGVWHALDMCLYPHRGPHAHIPSFGACLTDYALVMRPKILRHAPGKQPPSGRGLVGRVRDMLPYLGAGLLQYCICEALNAWLMLQKRGGWCACDEGQCACSHHASSARPPQGI